MTHPHNEHTMQCRELMAQVSAYIDSELEAHLCAELEAHLAGCDDCRIMLNTTRKTIELYRRHYFMSQVQLSPDVENRLRQALANAGCTSSKNTP